MSEEAWTPGELLEALEELRQLAEDLRARQEKLSEQLVPSEAALKARSEYLGRVLEEQLGEVRQHVLRLTDQVQQSNEAAQTRLLVIAEALLASERQRLAASARLGRRRVVWSTAALLVGGILAGLGASWGSRLVATDARPATLSSPEPTPAKKPAKVKSQGAPSAPRAPAS